MNDRELLELAAKAAGLNISEWTDDYDTGCFGHPDNGGSGFVIHGECTTSLWNSLTDDGDALRLAFSCGLGVDMYACWVQYEGEYETDYVEFEGGSLENVRRAIVRAAAAIGEAMQ